MLVELYPASGLAKGPRAYINKVYMVVEAALNPEP